MWPAFVALTFVDALIGSALPPAGDSWNAIGAGVAFGALNLIGIVALSVPVTLLLRHRRRDLPKVVAKDYAGTTAMVAITGLLVVAGIANRAHVSQDSRSTADAIVRAQAYIGDRAPGRFRSEMQYVNTYAIQAGSVYRVCVPSVDRTQTYCVIVRTDRPFSGSVSFAGYESNQRLSEGVN